MERLVVAAVLVVVAVVVAIVLERRRPRPARPPTFHVPPSVARGDFPDPAAPWLVALFSSPTCEACASAREATRALRADDVAVCEVPVDQQPALHERYGVDAVPLTVVVDGDGTVRHHVFGAVERAALEAELDELRAQG